MHGQFINMHGNINYLVPSHIKVHTKNWWHFENIKGNILNIMQNYNTCSKSLDIAQCKMEYIIRQF